MFYRGSLFLLFMLPCGKCLEIKLENVLVLCVSDSTKSCEE